jgi:hypothetical protein
MEDTVGMPRQPALPQRAIWGRSAVASSGVVIISADARSRPGTSGQDDRGPGPPGRYVAQGTSAQASGLQAAAESVTRERSGLFGLLSGLKPPAPWPT